MSGEPEAALTQNGRLKRRAQVGMVALTTRSVLQNVVILLANVYLARLLGPADYGVFGILQFALSLFKLIGDTGLGAALVQKKVPPDDVELSSIWWFQLGLGLLLVIATIATVPFLRLVWPTLPAGSEWLMPGLALSLLFTMLRTVPFLLLERAVNFGWVGTLEFLGTVVFYGTAVVLALRHAGAAALVCASVAQAALVSILGNLVHRWRPRFVFSWSRIRGLMKFGFAFQGNNVIGFLNSAVTPLLVGAKLGKVALGTVQFAQNTAWFPTLPIGIVRRVYFPYLSRLQHDRPLFVREFELAVALCALPTFFCFGLFMGGAPKLVDLIYGPQWHSAVPAIYLYSIGLCFTFYSWIGGAAIEALGNTSRIFKIQLLGTAVNWSATLVATALSPSVTGFACGFLVQLIVTPIAMYRLVRELLPEARSLRPVRFLFVAGVAAAAFGRVLLPWVQGISTLGVWVFAEVLVFSGVTLSLDARLRGVARSQWAKLRLSGR